MNRFRQELTGVHNTDAQHVICSDNLSNKLLHITFAHSISSVQRRS